MFYTPKSNENKTFTLYRPGKVKLPSATVSTTFKPSRYFDARQRFFALDKYAILAICIHGPCKHGHHRHCSNIRHDNKKVFFLRYLFLSTLNFNQVPDFRKDKTMI